MNFLSPSQSVQPGQIFTGKDQTSWQITGGFESDIEEGLKYQSLNELLLYNDAVIINDLFHTGFSELKHIIRHCRHVYVHQYLPLSNEELLQLQNLADEAQVVVQMGFQHRFSNFFQSVSQKEIVPRLIETHHFVRYKRRSTQLSIISDILLEDLDTILCKVNSDIRHINATGVGVIYNDPDIVNIRIEFQNACIANISASKIAIKDLHKTRFYQNNSYFTLDYISNSIKAFNSNDDAFWENTDESDNLSEQIESFKPQDYFELSKSELDSFFSAVVSKTKSKASLNDHLAIKFVAEKIYDQLERNFVAKCG